MLLTSWSRQPITDQVNATLSLLQSLGFRVNWVKSLTTPRQILEFLGIEVNSVQMTLQAPQSVHLTQDKNPVPETTTQRNLLSQRVISTNRPFNLTEDSDPNTPLFFRARQFDLISAVRLPKGDNQIITLSQSSLRDISWWIEEAPNWNSNPIVKLEIDLIIQTDASLTGLAASSQGQTAAGAWSPEEKTCHINVLQLRAVIFGVRLLLQTNNTTTIRYINKFGTTHSLPLCQLAIKLLEYTMQSQITLTAEYIPGKENTTAESLSRQSNPHQHEWRLCPRILNRILQHARRKSGSIRLTSEQPAREVCELAPRLRGHGGECLCTGLEETCFRHQSSLD